MTDMEGDVNEPTTEAGRRLLEREAYNSRSFALITAEDILAIESEASVTAPAGLDRSFVRKLLGRHHRDMRISGRNCSHCWNVRAALADAVLHSLGVLPAESKEPAPAGLDAGLVRKRARAALDELDVIDGIVDDSHAEGCGCPLCHGLDNLREVLDALAASGETEQDR